MELKEAKKLYLKAKRAYYLTGAPIMTDAKFDKLEASIATVEPGWKFLHSTGVKVGKKSSLKLPCPMPSLNKVTTNNPEAVQRWIAKQSGELVIMPKIDGASYELVYKNGAPSALITRGDGKVGEDVSHFLPYLNLPAKIGAANLVIRCEIAMNRKVFDKKWRGAFKSDRNLASGLFNRQDVHDAIKDMTVICLRLLNSPSSLSNGLDWLKAKGFETVPYIKLAALIIGVPLLSKRLQMSHKTYPFRLDGLVLHSNDTGLKETVDKPDFAVAFKENDEGGKLTTIKKITWEASKHGVLIPTAQIEPVEFDGATVRNVTINNASWAKINKMGVGAKINVIRSGDIIPKIVGIVKPGKFLLPSKAKHGDYAWDKNQTHLVLKNKSVNDEVAVSRLQQFYGAMDIDHLGPGHLAKMVDGGVRTSVRASKLDLNGYLKAGVPAGIAVKVVQQMEALRGRKTPLPKLVKASCIFERGIGERRVQKLLDAGEFNYLLTGNTLDVARIGAILGGTVAAQALADGWPAFMKWLKATRFNIERPETVRKPKLLSKKLEGVGVTWTGYRDAEQQLLVVTNGGTVESFGGKTTVLLYKADGKSSTKVEKAEAKGIKCLRWEQFVKAYKLI